MVYFYYESTGNILISEGLYVKSSAEKLKAATTGPGSPLPSSLPRSGAAGRAEPRAATHVPGHSSTRHRAMESHPWLLCPPSPH